jgi:hypothetical protein
MGSTLEEVIGSNRHCSLLTYEIISVRCFIIQAFGLNVDSLAGNYKMLNTATNTSSRVN